MRKRSSSFYAKDEKEFEEVDLNKELVIHKIRNDANT